MTIQTLIYVWAALSGAVFSGLSIAQELPTVTPVTQVKQEQKPPSVEWSKTEIQTGADVQPHSIPQWFARMATQPRQHAPTAESMVFQIPEVSSYVGRPPRIGRKYACQQPDKSWIFCD